MACCTRRDSERAVDILKPPETLVPSERMQPITPSAARTAAPASAPAYLAPRNWRAAADDIAFLVLALSLIWMLASLVFLALR